MEDKVGVNKWKTEFHVFIVRYENEKFTVQEGAKIIFNFDKKELQDWLNTIKRNSWTVFWIWPMTSEVFKTGRLVSVGIDEEDLLLI